MSEENKVNANEKDIEISLIELIIMIVVAVIVADLMVVYLPYVMILGVAFILVFIEIIMMIYNHKKEKAKGITTYFAFVMRKKKSTN